MHLSKNNSVKDFLINNKTTILKSKCKKLRYLNIAIRYCNKIQYFDNKMRYFDSKIQYFDCKSLLQIDSLYRDKTIRDLIKKILDTIYSIIEIALNA